MMKAKDQTIFDGVDTTPFLKEQEGNEKQRDQVTIDMKDFLKALKFSSLSIGVTIGICNECLSWLAHLAPISSEEDEKLNLWWEMLATVLFLFVLPMIFLELVHILYRATIQLTSFKTNEFLIKQLYTHIQSRLAAGFLCGVLSTLSVLDYYLDLRHHLLYNVLVLFFLFVWCLVEKWILDERGLLVMLVDHQNGLRGKQADTLPQVF